MYLKNAICLLPTFSHYLWWSSENSEKYVQKRARKPKPLPGDRKEYLATYTTEYDDNYVLEPIAANNLQEFRELAQNQRERQIEADFDYNTIRRYCGNGNNSRTHETGE